MNTWQHQLKVIVPTLSGTTYTLPDKGKQRGVFVIVSTTQDRLLISAPERILSDWLWLQMQWPDCLWLKICFSSKNWQSLSWAEHLKILSLLHKSCFIVIAVAAVVSSTTCSSIYFSWSNISFKQLVSKIPVALIQFTDAVQRGTLSFIETELLVSRQRRERSGDQHCPWNLTLQTHWGCIFLMKSLQGTSVQVGNFTIATFQSFYSNVKVFLLQRYSFYRNLLVFL